MTQNFEVFISERSITTFEDKIFKTPGDPYHIIEEPVYEYFCSSPKDANLLEEKV